MGLADESGQFLDRIEFLDRSRRVEGTRGFFGAELAIGRAWAWYGRGDVERARETVRKAADEIIGDANVITEGFLRHEAARLGAPDDRRNEALAAAVDGPLIQARLLHISGLAQHDPEILERASTAFAAIGCDLPAAEAARAAGRLVMAMGDSRRAARLEALAVAALSRCDGANTPGIRAIEPTWRLTDREADVAELAARGMTSKDIADRLFVAVRTIDNHLRNIFAKLNITSRQELAAVLLCHP
jgi:DNA-binding CsgD family transcriptional regulator